jgi:alcohol dehydrogenase
MKAMTYRGPYKVRIEEKDIPAIEHPNDAIVRVDLAAICGSDLHLYHGLMPDTRVGHTFGHEFIGVVETVGSSVQNLKPGDRVMVPFNIYCGSCYFCARGLYSNCHNVNPNATAVGGIYGYSHTCGGYDGGQAEFVRVHWRRGTSALSSVTSSKETPSSSSVPGRSACTRRSAPG